MKPEPIKKIYIQASTYRELVKQRDQMAPEMSPDKMAEYIILARAYALAKQENDRDQ